MGGGPGEDIEPLSDDWISDLSAITFLEAKEYRDEEGGGDADDFEEMFE